ncbi:MAG: DNA topoisomerase I, partial [Candidatus Bathyarchaeota archaeon]|nr:DNA topoisomerase I [Candidatus Bathyarchaeota archaeon]
METHTLIVAEKPAAALRIAVALDSRAQPTRLTQNGVPYYVVHRDNKIIVASVLGHLYTVAQKNGKRSEYPIFRFKWAPRHEVDKKAAHMIAWIKTLESLAENADTFVNACDYDVEGSLIGYNALHHACGGAQAAKRMKYSTLTKPELEEAYDHLLPTLDYNLVKAGKTRHEVDWLYGINLSRALTQAAKRATGKYVSLSTGRVQGPALRFLVERENKISCFVPTPFWTIKAKIQIKGRPHEAQYERRCIKTEAEAEEIVETCRRKGGEVEAIEERIFTQSPPTPFNLSTLQDEAYRLFGCHPRQTAKIAERLYLAALISYPRTDSQKLPSVIGYKAILRKMQKKLAYGELISELLKSQLAPNEGKKEDPAHPAVYPTGNLPDNRLNAPSRKLWDLIARRFMATFGKPATKQTTKVTINVNGTRFFLLGRRTVKEGWIRFYRPHITTEHRPLPEVSEGERLMIASVSCEASLTRPPPRYNPSSFLKRMESEGIGTKGTRAEIIQTLYDRKLAQNQQMQVTGIGRAVLEVLQEYAPSITSVELTRNLEEKVELIKAGKEDSGAVLEEAVTKLRNTIREMKKSEVE